MNNIEKYPEAFDAQGIPKVGGKWKWPHSDTLTVERADGEITHYGDGFDETHSLHNRKDVTFLGFSDPPVNQGAAAPQAASVVKPCQMITGGTTDGTCGKPPAWHWQRKSEKNRDYFFCAEHNPGGNRDAWSIVAIGPPAPVPATPPSRQAAVQEEGLAILPQTGVRHEEYETLAQKAEGAKNFHHVKGYLELARKALPLDLAYDLEASAIREGRVVLKSALKEMGLGVAV